MPDACVDHELPPSIPVRWPYPDAFRGLIEGFTIGNICSACDDIEVNYFNKVYIDISVIWNALSGMSLLRFKKKTIVALLVVLQFILMNKSLDSNVHRFVINQL